MNRTQRLKSQLGKAQKSHRRRRGVDRYHQVLISDYLERTHTDPDAIRLVPVVRGAYGQGPATATRDASVRVIGPEPAEPASAALAAPLRPRRSSPAAVSPVARTRAPESAFTLRGFLRGFLMGAVPAAAMVALYLLLAT